MTPEGNFLCAVWAIVFGAIVALVSVVLTFNYYSDAQDYERDIEMAELGYSQVIENVNGYSYKLWKKTVPVEGAK